MAQLEGPQSGRPKRDTGVPTQWSASEGVAWKLPMPTWSGSTPIVSGEYVFVSTADAGDRVARNGYGARGEAQAGATDPAAERLSLWCIDRNTGKVLWKRGLGGGNKQLFKQNMSSPSPVTDGKRVWALTGAGVLKGFDLAGTELWEPRPPEGLRCIRLDVGLRLLADVARRSPLRSGASRHEDR